MAVSFAQAQAALLADNFLERLGETRGPDEVNLDKTAAAIVRVAGEFVEDATNNIRKKDLVSSGNLESSIRPEIVEIGANTIIDIKVAEYYKYVDKGVKGWAGSNPGEFQFKKTPPGRKMVASIAQWLQREGNGARNVKVAISPREAKRLSADPNARAFVVAAAVKKKGIVRTNFWTDAVRELENKIASGVADALRIDVTEQIVP